MSRNDVANWSHWRKCPTCGAETGESCTDFIGVFGNGDQLRSTMAKPHHDRQRSTRKTVKP